MARWVRAVGGVAVAAVFLGAAELVLRGLLGPPPPAVRVFAGLQSPEDWLVWDGDQVRAASRSAADGPRTQGFSCGATGPRILFLGGSSVHGGSPGLSEAQEFPALVGQALGVEALNLAAPGLDSHSLVELYEDFGDCRADLVVAYSGHNDLGNVRFYDRYGTVAQGVAARVSSRLGQLQLYVQLRRAVGGESGQERAVGGKRSHVPDALETERVGAALVAFEANVKRLRWLTAEQGQTLVLIPPLSDLLSKPVDQTCDEDRCPQQLHAAALVKARSDPAAAADMLREARDQDLVALRAPTRAHAILAAAAGDHVVLVDLEATVPQDATVPVPASALFADAIHFSAEGHEAVARALRDPLADLIAR